MQQKAREPLYEFGKELSSAHPVLERAALLVAGVVNDHVDLDHYMEELDRIAATVAQSMPAEFGLPRAQHLLDTLYHQLGFIGNQTEYYDPRNSYLTEVLDRRTGLPILLSLVYIAVGRRLKLRVEGMGLPLHFMVRYVDEAGVWLIDPFHGRLLLVEEVETYLSGMFKQHITITGDALRPVSVLDMIKRILVNLRNVYVNAGDYAQAARIIDHMLLLNPNEASWWQERALFHFHSNDQERAARDLRRYFFLTGRLHLAIEALNDPEEDNQAALDGLSSSDRYLLDLLHQIEDLRLSIN